MGIFATAYVIILVLQCCCNTAVRGQLSQSFYDQTCPQARFIVRRVVSNAVFAERRMAASLLRLYFHDCFVNGCDGSILLDDSSTITGEKNAFPNANSVRGFEVIDGVKGQLEVACPGVVSCADALAMSAQQAVLLIGGPSWALPLGQKDSRTASRDAANRNIPSPRSQFSQLVSTFQSKGLNIQDLIALSGAHTIGFSRCSSFSDRLYNFSGSGQPDPNLALFFRSNLQSQCPAGNTNNLVPLDFGAPNSFDSSYFRNLLNGRGVLNSDQLLAGTNSLVSLYAGNFRAFFNDFSNAMSKMGSLTPSGTALEIRRNCRIPN